MYNVESTKEGVRDSLRHMTTEEITRGMSAFAEQPRMSSQTCFCAHSFGRDRSWFDALEGREVRIGSLSYAYEVSPGSAIEEFRLAALTHGDMNEWLRLECIRELAERGVVVEQKVQEAATCG